MKRVTFLLVIAALLVAGAVGAEPIGKGASIFSIQLTEGTADLIGTELAGYVGAYEHSELGVQAQFWHFMADDYAFNLSGGVGFFNETDEPGDNAIAGDEDFKYSQTSWQVRVGGDRVGHIGDRFVAFAGPGIQVWSGKAKFEGGPAPGGSVETESTMRIALSVRYGGLIRLGEGFGLMGHLGHYWGYATAEDTGAKAKWWPTGHDGAAGFAFNF